MNLLGKKILKDVSRSFYLSMRVLPQAMREPVSLGYLLARASDTLADSDGLDVDLRLEMLAGFGDVLIGEERGRWLQKVCSKVVPEQRHQGEKVLLGNLEGVFAWLDEVCVEQKDAIFTVMGHILRGQMLDVERFELEDGFRFTEDSELEEYCYLVAGCVGEFWTEVGEMTLGCFSDAKTEQLMGWGANYGKGLQLINILRDLPSDLKVGRCYLPGVDPGDGEALAEESARWRVTARRYLEEGKCYADSLKRRRVRAATVLPGLIGEKTLDLMDAADWADLERGVKVSRGEIYRCVWDALVY